MESHYFVSSFHFSSHKLTCSQVVNLTTLLLNLSLSPRSFSEGLPANDKMTNSEYLLVQSLVPCVFLSVYLMSPQDYASLNKNVSTTGEIKMPLILLMWKYSISEEHQMSAMLPQIIFQDGNSWLDFQYCPCLYTYLEDRKHYFSLQLGNVWLSSFLTNVRVAILIH